MGRRGLYHVLSLLNAEGDQAVVFCVMCGKRADNLSAFLNSCPAYCQSPMDHSVTFIDEDDGEDNLDDPELNCGG